ncbi:MAG TPA: T9SS type A sorting domain-containing protein [Ignavibacteria bacterium]|nr:T9SS type A sorting domain-containing protein [Ignavibacteria bacterium]
MRFPNSKSHIKFKILFLIFFISLTSRNADSAIINITVSDFVFTPANVLADVGDTVRWNWIGTRTHSTTCDGSFPGTVLPPGASPWDQTLNSGIPVFEYIIQVAGTYSYVCSFHAPDMAGTIIADEPLPVELTDFVATTIKNEVILDWSTSGELNNARFEIQRIDVTKISDHNPKKLEFMTIGVLSGNGTINHIHNYRFTDRNLKTGIYLYRLRQVDFNSNFIYHFLGDEVVVGIPSVFNLSQNYPNPFNPVTKINYELPADGFVTVSLFDISGKLVSTLINENRSAGYQTLEFNGSGFSSGVYYYRIEFNNESGSESITKKMLLVK